MRTDLPDNGNSTELPKVSIVTTRDRFLGQDYENAEVFVTQEKEDIAAFNAWLNQAGDGDIAFFLPNTDDFARRDAISLMVTKLESNPYFGCVYSDNLNEHIPIRYTAFGYETVMSRKIINSPILYRKNGPASFDAQFETLFLHRFIIQTSKPDRIAAHIPKTLIVRDKCRINQAEVQMLHQMQ